MMSGKALMSALILFAVLFAAALWYFQTRAFYQKVDGVTQVFAYGDAFEVSDYQGIDAETSPLKMRACFIVDWDYWPSTEFADRATPLKAPGWFDCFDERQLAEDLASGDATAILAEENQPYGIDRFIVQYPDGRAYMWRQINDCGASHFQGDPLPDHCPNPDDS